MNYVLFFVGLLLFFVSLIRYIAERKKNGGIEIKISILDSGIDEEDIVQMVAKVTYYIPWLTFTYNFEGNEYFIDRRRISDERVGDVYAARKILEKIKLDEVVYIYPERPNEPIFILRPEWELLQRKGGGILGGILLVVIALIIGF